MAKSQLIMFFFSFFSTFSIFLDFLKKLFSAYSPPFFFLFLPSLACLLSSRMGGCLVLHHPSTLSCTSLANIHVLTTRYLSPMEIYSGSMNEQIGFERAAETRVEYPTENIKYKISIIPSLGGFGIEILDCETGIK